jgi:hypothetical protein
VSGSFHRPIASQSELADAINEAIVAGAIGTPILLSALYRGEICHQQIVPGGSVSAAKQFLRGAGDKPSVLLIGDDDGANRGPPGWPGAPKAVEWGRWFLLHAAGAEPKHYQLAIAMAQIHRRVVVIECTTSTLPAWIAMTEKARNRVGGMVIYPRGGVHPMMPDRAAVH